jgi:hypothetical protein
MNLQVYACSPQQSLHRLLRKSTNTENPLRRERESPL